MEPDNNKIPCPQCQGEGKIPMGDYHVTREMAIDAGDPSLEGTLYGHEYERCRSCDGDGFVERIDNYEQDI